MSVYLKVLVLLLSYGVLWLQVRLDYKKPWSDKRTRLHRLGFSLLTWVLLPAAVIGSVALIVIDDRAARNADQQLASIRGTLESVAAVVGVSTTNDVVTAVESLRKRVDAQQEEIATAHRDLLDTKAQVGATSKQADAALKAAVSQAPRTVSAADQEKLVGLLQQGPKGEINMQIPISAGGEAQALSGVLERSLLAAGWTIPNRAVIPISNEASGIYLVVKSSVAAPKRAAWLQRALGAVGLTAQGTENAALAPDQVDLIVARKPDK